MTYFKNILLFLFIFVSLRSVCPPNKVFHPVPSDLPLDKIELPEGFKIDLFASDVNNARALALGDNGTVFVGSRKAGLVHALVDKDQDFIADEKIVVAENLNLPTGLTFHNGDLYVMEIDKLWKYENIEENLDKIPEPKLISDQFPDKTHHGWKFIRFGPDGHLYIPVGAPCNVCEEEEEIFATICRLNIETGAIEIIARGVRNSVGFDWHPRTGELWFTENGRDWMADDRPPDELNRLTEPGQHFGFPYCHGGMYLDPDFGKGKNCDDYIAPAQKLGAHVAAIGMRFYTGSQFPEMYKNQILIAEHGSWNSKEKVGYQVSLVTLDDDGNAINYEPFAKGWVLDGSVWGRPADVQILEDGSLLVSDDYANAIYRISY